MTASVNMNIQWAEAAPEAPECIYYGDITAGVLRPRPVLQESQQTVIVLSESSAKSCRWRIRAAR